MIRKALLAALFLALLLAAAGCGTWSQGKGAGGDGKEKKTPQAGFSQSTRPPGGPETAPPGGSEATRPAGEPEAARKDTSGEAPDIVIRTENRVSSQEAGAILDEMDKQLAELINTLNRLEDPDDRDLEY